MFSKKRKIASALTLGATVTGAISSGATSAGLFDWFRSKEDLNNEIIEKQKKGYDAAIQVAKNIYKMIKDDKENNNKDKENNNKEKESKSILELVNKLISEREKLFLKNLGVSIDQGDNLEFKEDIANNLLENIEDYFEKKLSTLQKKTKQFIEIESSNNITETESKIYKLYNSEGKESSIKITGKTSSRINILRNTCNNFVMKNINGDSEPNLTETLINIAKEDTLGQYKTEEPKMPLLNLSYEDLIKNLIENTMKDSNITYRDDFYKIFESEGVATILHELGYEENMSLLPSYDKEKGGLSIGRAARSFVPTTIVWTLGYFYPPITVVGGIVGLLCNAVVQQSASSLWNNLRHKETRTSFLNPNSWEVNKFVNGVFSSFVIYSIFKYLGF